jgi:REP element-mobilizing transposase RayT
MNSESSSLSNEDLPSFYVFLPRSAAIEVVTRHMPHWQFDGGLYFVTWRLADSLPQALLRQWAEEKRIWLGRHPKPWDAHMREEYRRAFPRRIEAWLDAGYGDCVLRYPECAGLLSTAMREFDGVRYDIASFVIMPNHVHALFQLRDGFKIRPILKAWKGVSARRVNQLLGRRGKLWQQESRDTSIRSPQHLLKSFAYILENPEKANISDGGYLYYEIPGIRKQLRSWSGDFDDT